MKKALLYLPMLLLSLPLSAAADEGWQGSVGGQAQLDAGPGLRFGIQAEAHAPKDESIFRLETLFSDKGAAGFSLGWEANLPAGFRLLSRIVSIDDPFAPFYGFNGAAEARKEDAYPARNAFHKGQLQAGIELSAPIAGALRWQLGFNCHYIDAQRISSAYGFDSATLFDRYDALELLRPEEHSGGERIATQLGISLNTKHLHGALAADLSPDLFRDGNAYARLGAIISCSTPHDAAGRFRLEACAFAQHSLSGQTPWYLLDNLMLAPDGGAPLRCALPGRFLARGYAGARFDLHVTLMGFRNASREWKVDAVPFCDLLLLTQSYRLHEMTLANLGDEQYEAYLLRRSRLPHESAGLKLQVHAPGRCLFLQAGAPFHREDGLMSLNLGVRFAF